LKAVIGTFFEDTTFAIRELGVFEAGESVKLSLYLEKDNLYIKNGCDYFWYLDTEAFRTAAEELSAGTLKAYSEKDDRIYGKITVSGADSVIFTSIPYDSGWNIYIDGEKCAYEKVLNGTLIAFSCPAGEHEIEFRYRPDAVVYGGAVSIAGAVVFAAVILVDEFVIKRRKKEADI